MRVEIVRLGMRGGDQLYENGIFKVSANLGFLEVNNLDFKLRVALHELLHFSSLLNRWQEFCIDKSVENMPLLVEKARCSSLFS